MSDNTSVAGVGGGDAWAALVGSLGVMGNSMLSSWLGNKSSKKAQARAYGYWKRSVQEAPSLTRKGLEAAGYNPMLALGNIGGQAFSANSTPSFAPVGDMVGGAEAGARLGNQLLRGIKLDNEKKTLENKNLETDLDTKEAQLGVFDAQKARLEADTALAISQAERSDLAYGRDIVDTVATIAGTGASMYSAKAMSDVAKANSAIAARNATVNERNATVNERKANTQTYEVRRDAKGRKVGEIQRSTRASGIPSVSSSANSPAPNVGGVGHSAKVASNIARRIAEHLLYIAPLAPIGAAAWGAAEGFSADEKSTYKRMEKAKEKSYWSNLRLR